MQIKIWVATYAGKELITMTTKMTKRDFYAILSTIVAERADAEYSVGDKTATAGEVQSFIEHEVALLSKKATDRKPTATQTENEGYTNDILNAMELNTLYSIGDIQAAVPSVAGLSNQRMSAILRNAVAAGTLVKVSEKRKSYWKLA